METKRTEVASSTVAKSDTNRDPMTCAPCATSIVETAGRAKGTAIAGGMGQENGLRADAVGPAVTGGIADGKNAAVNIATEPVNSTAEHKFWRNEFQNRPYFTSGTPYDQYGPAFQYGWESYASHMGKEFNDVEPQLGRDWENHRGQSKLSWDHSKDAMRDAWQRVEKRACVDSCSSV